jgi:transposase
MANRWSFAMPIPLRPDFDAAATRAAARRSKDGGQARRLLALAVIYEGVSRTEAERIGGVTLQIIRDWVVKFNATGPDGLIDRKAPGQPSILNATHRAALVEAIESGPIPAAHGVVRWRISTHPVRLAITPKYLNRLHVSERKLLNRMNQL